MGVGQIQISEGRGGEWGEGYKVNKTIFRGCNSFLIFVSLLHGDNTFKFPSTRSKFFPESLNSIFERASSPRKASKKSQKLFTLEQTAMEC